MSVENQDQAGTEDKNKKPEGEKKPEVQAGAGAGEKPADKKPEVAAGDKGGQTTTVTTQKKVKVLAKDDDEADDDDDFVQMSARGLKNRLTRASNSEKNKLFAKYGVKDEEELEAKLKSLKALEDKQEEERQKNLTELEKEREARTKAEQRAKKNEERAEAVEQERFNEKTDKQAAGALGEFIAEEEIEDQLPALKRHLAEVASTKDFKRRGWLAIAKEWAEDRVEKRPRLGKNYDPAKDGAKKVAANNGVTTHTQQPDPKTQNGSKTAAPGRPNSMSDEELRAQGFKFGRV